MKNKKFLFISLLILAIGFAAVSTTLYISGNLLFGTNKNDFEVYFSGAIIDNEDKSNEVILSDKKHIEYETKELKTLGDTSVLEFEVTNNSTQYDAKVSISCSLSDGEYVSYTTDKQEYKIPAQTRKSGKVIVELIKVSTSTLNPTISCELVSTAEERTSGAETVITDNLYEITGSLTDEEGNVLANKNLVVYSETPHYVTTDDYGFFYVNGLEKGSHEIYYLDEENVEGKTKEEVKELSASVARITTNSTSINFDNIKLNDFKINVEKEEEINITLDADSGSIDSNTLKLNKYQKGSKLPTPTPKNSNYEFLGWYSGDKKITNNTIITSEMNLIAKWNRKCEYDESYIWNYDYTGGEQTFIVPCDGTYKLETWGAEGGKGSFNLIIQIGGYGAYAVGNLSLQKNDKNYIYVGGKGKELLYTTSSLAGVNVNGNGYNGGGDANGRTGEYGVSGGGGGGATHISTSQGLLSTQFLYVNNLIMVAAGGGGGMMYGPGAYPSWTGVGGHAGGVQGGSAKNTNSNYYCQSYGGTQNSGGISVYNSSIISDPNVCIPYYGSFGKGGMYPDETIQSYGYSAGGGGGYYGGAGSVHGAAGGGSSYIGNSTLTNKAMYCYNCATSNVESTKTISTTCTSATPTANCAKQGNGYARITLVSLD